MSLFAVAALTLASCHKDNASYDDGKNNVGDNIGYLVLGGLEATVMEDTETVNNGTASKAATRAIDVDFLNTFDVVIEKASEGSYTQVKSFKYGERPEIIELEGGIYRLTMSSATMEGAAWESPVYSAKKEFVITRLQTTEVKDIVCKLSNIKVTVAYSADIADQLDLDRTTMTIAVADNALEYTKTDAEWILGSESSAGRPGYFAPENTTSTLKLTLKCYYVGQDKEIVMTNEIKGVRAAQWHKVNVTIQHASDGTATLGITCDTWTYDEEVTFDTTNLLFEEVLVDDTDMPEIKWEGHDLAQEVEMPEEDFDAEGNYLKSINIDILSKTPIAALNVKAASDSTEFMNDYTSVVPADIDLCSTTISNTMLAMFGYVKVADNTTSVQLKFAKMASMMRDYEGIHTFTITVKDVNGRESVATLTVNTVQSVEPVIRWAGYNIDERQTYVEGMTCDLTVKAPLAIADFVVEIISETLTEDVLANDANLAKEFSLVKDTQFFEQLTNFNFPTGDAVEGQTSLNLSITSFLNVLAMLGSGDHDFKMTVIDTAGNTTTKTVMFHFE